MTVFRVKNCCRRVALLLGCSSSLVYAADSIIVSKPDVELAAPKSAGPAISLPNGAAEIRAFSFGQPQQPAAPYIPPPIIRTEPRKREKRSLFDEPEMFSDKSSRRDTEENPFGSPKVQRPAPKPLMVPGSDLLRREENDRALSPVWNFNSMVRQDEKRRSFSNEESRENRHSEDDGLFRRRDDRDYRNDEASRLGFFGTSKREISREAMKRRADFDRLINNDLAPLGPINPVAGNTFSPLNVARPPAPVSIPVIAPEKHSLNPMQAYEDKQRSWRGPTIDDLNKKVFGSTVSASPSKPAAIDTRPSLMRQPTMHDFPSRQF
jgi:hypothetical protein